MIILIYSFQPPDSNTRLSPSTNQISNHVSLCLRKSSASASPVSTPSASSASSEAWGGQVTCSIVKLACPPLLRLEATILNQFPLFNNLPPQQFLRIAEPKISPRYVALSYVWVNCAQLNILIKGPESIEVKNLPRTIKDAIRLTKLLRKHYI